jgi:autotransporter-associated beta strand protein
MKRNIILPLLIVALIPVAGFAASATWIVTAGGTNSWNSDGNWTAAFPNAQDEIASLTADITGDQIVDLGQAIMVGGMYVGDANSTHRFTITNTTANALTFQSSGGISFVMQIATSLGDTIAADIILASNLAATNAYPATSTSRPLIFSGNISETGGSRQLQLASVNWSGFVLSGSNSYSGGTAVTSGNGDVTPLELRNGNALGSGPVTGLTHLVFNMSTESTVSNLINITAGNGTPFKNIGSGRVNLSGSVAGANNAWSVLAGNGSDGGFVLSGSNSFVRPLIDNTTVWANSNKAFNSAIAFADQNHSGKLYLMNGITLSQGIKDFWFANSNTGLVFTLGTDQTNINCSFTGSITLRMGTDPPGINTWMFQSGAGSTVTLSGAISQAYYTNLVGGIVYNPVVKIGAGTVALSGANTYGGVTTISNGTLWVNNSTGSGTGTGRVDVCTNGVLGGVGTISGPVTVEAGGVLAAGTNGTGMLTLSGGLVLSSNALFSVQARGTNAVDYNTVTISSGSVSLTNSVLSLSFANGYEPSPGDTFTVIRNVANNPVAGTFTCGSRLKLPGLVGSFQVNYANGVSNDVVLKYKAAEGTVIMLK